MGQTRDERLRRMRRRLLHWMERAGDFDRPPSASPYNRLLDRLDAELRP